MNNQLKQAESKTKRLIRSLVWEMKGRLKAKNKKLITLSQSLGLTSQGFNAKVNKGRVDIAKLAVLCDEVDLDFVICIVDRDTRTKTEHLILPERKNNE